jgi:hypothetical protein
MRKNVVVLKFAIVAISTVAFLFCLFWLPMLADTAAEMNPEYAHLALPVLIGIYITVIPFYIAIYQAFRLLDHIEREKAFSSLAVVSLKRIKNCAIAIALIYGAGMTFLIMQKAAYPSITAIGVVIIFTASSIALLSAVFQELLSSAIAIKSENDLTV